MHAELAWPGGGSVLIGGTKHTDSVRGGFKVGAVYVVTDEVEALHSRLLAAEVDVVAAPHVTKFAAGGPTTACAARDPEGNLWTFATRHGAA